jgi:predicted helicase
MTPLQTLLTTYCNNAQTEREKGSYFEELICTYLRHEPIYKTLYEQVWLFSDWAKEQGKDARDVGIDLVAKTRIEGEFHAIQCKFYDFNYKIQKKDIDSFFTASGQAPFTRRIIVSTTIHWTDHADNALISQTPPITKIDLTALEESLIDWSNYQPGQKVVTKVRKDLRPHQQNALTAVQQGLAKASRGKLIMACGTGKTFTALKIAETLAGPGKQVLFLVPSLSLLSQTLTEWTQESATPIHSFAVCSDSQVGKKRNKKDDKVELFVHELRYPATTNAARLAEEFIKSHENDHMSVVFSTYHSIEVISQAQHQFNLPDFDLIICDEAHRTTGATFVGEDESNFVKVHDNDKIRGHKRLYMTATPRIYGDNAKADSEKGDVVLASMDDDTLFGKEFYTLNFSEAVSRGLLVDYKVIVLGVDEAHINKRLQNLLKDEDNSLKIDDAAKIIGCWKALSKQQFEEGLECDLEPMRRAVAFCQVIEPNPGAKQHKVSSKEIAIMFQAVVEAYQAYDGEHGTLICEAEHVDGSMNASEKESKLAWLKADLPEKTCRILSNVRCLSEGVDVPALDAVLFLTPRNSQVDVVQSVGRVMRIAAGKNRGYIILPVVIPNGVKPHEALNDNKTYRVVWEVLQALRSHDDHFDAMVNQIDINQRPPIHKMEVIAVNDQAIRNYSRKKQNQREKLNAKAKSGYSIGKQQPPVQQQELNLNFEPGEVEKAIYAKLVEKCGNRHHWEDWANDIARIANTHINRIRTIIDIPDNKAERKAFHAFVRELQDDLNPSITEAEVIEMLAQHLITEPVFEALFEGYSFGQHNPVAKGMQTVINLLHEHHLEKESDTLQKFYASVKLRAEGIDNAAGKQKIIVELYDKFFRNAFPRMTERLGIVYTPVEVVDFIIHSINHLLQTEFNQTLGSKGVHILDPFTGTGTFITRLLQSGLITPEQLPHKYQNELHANEIVLLAYYIAAINIEAVYHGQMGGDYQPFPGICLTDTFQLHEQDDLIQEQLVENSERRMRQKGLKEIRVIIGNPPYSIGQKSENDNNDNISYPKLDERIRTTYAERSKATTSKGLYDSYIRAIRWASDRIGDSGVVGLISGSGFIEKPAMDGMRKTMVDEFTAIYVLNLRGDIRKNMLSKGRAKEGQNIFGSGSMTGIAITLFVKNPQSNKQSQIFYHNIGDELTTEQKKETIANFISVHGISQAKNWQSITPDEYGDWLNQRDDSFAKLVVMGDKRSNQLKLFNNFSLGIGTNRDVWCYNSSRKAVEQNMEKMITFYNSEVARFNRSHAGLSTKERQTKVDGFINTDPTQISWSSSLKPRLGRGENHPYNGHQMMQSIYRPFNKQWFYYDPIFNHRVGQMPHIFPHDGVENMVICVAGTGARSGFSVLISKNIVDLQTIDNGQHFPLYLYDEDSSNQRDAITDAGLAHFTGYYSDEMISKADIFYYCYGLLHSETYRQKYVDNLSKELPRIPRVKFATDFWAFSKAGRDLANWHLNYETVTPYPAIIKSKATEESHYHVKKMKHLKKIIDGKRVNDKTIIVYNHRITIEEIPLEAYDYIVNGKSAIDWVMERQVIKTDKASGIINDANDWAIETMHNPKYPLELLLRVITVSLETIKIVRNLPTLVIE